MNIAYFKFDEGACGFYRAIQPMTALAKNGHNVMPIEKGDTFEDIAKAIDRADIVFAPHLSDPKILAVLKEFKKHGKKIVIDFDDDMFNVSPLSFHYNENGVENFQIEVEGEMLKVWEDGVTPGFDIAKNKVKLGNIKEALEMADMVTTTTEILADRFREYNKNVKALPNCIDSNIWSPVEIKKNNDEVRLYWAGGSSHYEDWCILADVLADVMRKYDNVKLVLMGHKFDGTLKGIPKDRIEYHEWVPTAAYPYKTILNNADICVIPLQDTMFNECKSAIKWIEMASLGIPSVVSGISPYIEMNDGDNGLFIEENTYDGWMQGISMLIEDSVLRAKMGGEAKRTVESKFDINKEYKQWETAYKELI